LNSHAFRRRNLNQHKEPEVAGNIEGRSTGFDRNRPLPTPIRGTFPQSSEVANGSPATPSATGSGVAVRALVVALVRSIDDGDLGAARAAARALLAVVEALPEGGAPLLRLEDHRPTYRSSALRAA